MSGFAINHIVLSGNLTRDPELRTLPSGTAICSVRMANNTRRKDNATGEYVDKANYFDVTVWSGMGEWVAREMRKGESVVVDGRMEWREWQDKDGNKRQSYEIVADSVVPVGRRENGGQSREPDLSVEDPPAASGQASTNGHEPGSLEDTQENIQKHCICRPGAISDKCPIDKHGIPF